LATLLLHGNAAISTASAANLAMDPGSQTPPPTGTAKPDTSKDSQPGQSAPDASKAPALSAEEAARNRELVRKRMQLCQQHPEVCVQRDKDQINDETGKRGNPSRAN
jgi:hypothetical protein